MTDDRLIADPVDPAGPFRISTARTAAENGRRIAAVAWASLALILLLAAMLRLPGIPRYILEQDEIYTFYESTRLFHVELRPGIEARPFYYLLQHALFWIVPPTTVWMRIPPFIFGMLGIALTWRCAQRVFGLTAATVAGVLVAISPWHIHVSGMARYWSLLYLLSVAFVFVALRAYDRDRPADYRLALRAAVLGSATHPTFLFTMAGVALGLCFGGGTRGPGWRWPTRRAWANLWLPYGAALLIGALALRFTSHDDAVRNWGGRGWSASLRLLPAITEWAGPTIVMAALSGAILLVFRSRDTIRRQWGWVALLGCTVTVALLTAASFFTDAYADYSIAMLPLVFISAGALVQFLSDRLTHAATLVAVSVACIICAGILPSTVSHLMDGSRFDYRPLFARIGATEPQLPVVTWPLAVQRVYAPQLHGRDLRMSTRYLDAQMDELGAFWLIASLRRYGMVDDPDRSVQRWILRHCSFTDSHERVRLDDRRYRVELYRCAAGAAP